jgi:hypothetical protein
MFCRHHNRPLPGWTIVMVLVQANGRDSPQEGPFDRLRNTEGPFWNGF